MKKLIVCMVVSAFMLAPIMSMAQDAKPVEKAKKECTAAEKKECAMKSDKKECCKKGEKKECCMKKAATEKKVATPPPPPA
ncbi:MAG: hypothetical protein WCJ03_04835, partial [Bacteroidales bacterium]